MEDLAIMAIVTELENINWNFKRYRQKGIDNIHWFPANFIPQIPSILIANLSKRNSIVLDPFCGSGTTLVESVRLDRIGIGIDTNYLAFLITKVKTTYIEPRKLKKLINTFEYLLYSRKCDLVLIPDFPNKDRWFHNNTLKELGSIFYLINSTNNKKIKNLLLVCFSAILKKCCTQRDHYTYIADNMFPKNHESLVYINAKNAFLSQLNNTVNSIIGFYDNLKIQGINPKLILSKCKTFNEDARLLKSINDNMVDIIVTSPPYANVNDYTTGNRLSFYWLNQDMFDKNKKDEIGARWKRSRKDALNDYINDMHLSFIHFKRVLKKGGYFCCILGETSSIKKKIVLNKKIIDILTNELGFKILSRSIKRNIYAKRIRAVRGVNEEYIYILGK